MTHAPEPVQLLLADVDGTLVTSKKELTPAAIEAVQALDHAGIFFALTSGRPPRGMSMLIEPLHITTPLSAFNGGLVVQPDMSILEQKMVDPEEVADIVALMRDHHLDVWLYQGAEWLVMDPLGGHVAKEAATVEFQPTVVDSFDGMSEQVSKIVGVSDDHQVVEQAEAAAQHAFGATVTANRSQPYYLDVTNPKANKGSVVDFLSQRLHIPPSAIATIGDMQNDEAMFDSAGLSIAMGNAEAEVQKTARFVTATNDDEGFAQAVHHWILGTEGASKP